MESTDYPASRSFRDYLIESFQDPEDAAGYLTAILEEPDPEPELLALALDDVALGYEGDREWVKDFGASDKSQVVYEFAAWLDSLGLRLTVTMKRQEKLS